MSTTGTGSTLNKETPGGPRVDQELQVIISPVSESGFGLAS
jgi:hypothetical protein